MVDALNVRQRLLDAAKQEFIRYGFKDASLRNIAAAAGMTTGAIYTYFKDKNALFEAIVGPVCLQVDAIFDEMSQHYYDENSVISEITTQNTLADLHEIYGFIYANFEVFRLLVVGAEGSSRADFVHSIVDNEVKHTMAYLERMKIIDNSKVHMDCSMVHIISEGYINAILEPVRHNMRLEEALKNLNFLIIFYTGGWQSIFEEVKNKKKEA